LRPARHFPGEKIAKTGGISPLAAAGSSRRLAGSLADRAGFPARGRPRALTFRTQDRVKALQLGRIRGARPGQLAIVDLMFFHTGVNGPGARRFHGGRFQVTGTGPRFRSLLIMDETERQSEDRGWDTAKTLAEALPYIQIYDRKTVVIKYGGHAMGESAVAKQFAADVVLLKLMGVNPVVVHGGGPQISAMLDKAGVKSAFVDGLRVTDADTMQVAEMVLSGAVNKEIAHWITMAGREADVRGVGLSGKDAGLLTVEKTKRTKRDPDSMIEHEVDLGFVGEPTRVDPKLIKRLLESDADWVPVIAPIGVTEEGQTFNVNADTVAGAVAGSLGAKRMLLLTDVPGVKGADGEIIRQMTVGEAAQLIADGVATGGMIPKLQTAIAAVRDGVEAVVILDGRRPHAMLVELFTEHGAGTLVKAG
jgi:acetylglutamate kinase